MSDFKIPLSAALALSPEEFTEYERLLSICEHRHNSNCHTQGEGWFHKRCLPVNNIQFYEHAQKWPTLERLGLVHEHGHLASIVWVALPDGFVQ